MSRINLKRMEKKAVDLAGTAVGLLGTIQKMSIQKIKGEKEEPPKRKEVITMKKSTFAAILVFLSAAVGALVAAYMYIQRRERELDEYEQLLFSEEFNQTVPSMDDEEEESHEVPAPAVVEPDLSEDLDLNA